MDPNPTPVAPQAPIAEPVAPAPQPQAAAPIASDGKKSNKTALIAVIAAVAVAVIVGVVVAIIMLGGNKPSGEGGGNGGSTNNGGTSTDTNLSKCGDAFKCLEKIDEDATVESINELTGIEGKVSSYSDTVYTWEFSNGESLKFSTSYFGIEVDYETKLHKDSSVDLDGYNSIKDQVKSGVTLDELVSALGGKKGLLYKKDYSGTGYLWVDGDGGYLRASVSNSGKITFISGWF